MVRVCEKRDEGLAGKGCQIPGLPRVGTLGADSVHASIASIPVVAGIDVGNPGIVEVSDVDRSVGPHRAMNRTEPLVIGQQGFLFFHGLERASVFLHADGMNLVAE